MGKILNELPAYPDATKYLDQTDKYDLSATEKTSGGKTYVIITQKGQDDSGEVLFEKTGTGLAYIDGDSEVAVGPKVVFTPAAALRCELSDPSDIDAVYREATRSVDRFSSASGPDGGNLACVWAVRHIAFNALGRWITRTDGTAVFDPELQKCFGADVKEKDVSAGGIIISATQGSNIGHVGLLGPYTGDGNRLIYSNSSSAAKWKQNFTLEKWIARYKTTKGLKVRFYPIPMYVNAGGGHIS